MLLIPPNFRKISKTKYRRSFIYYYIIVKGAIKKRMILRLSTRYSILYKGIARFSHRRQTGGSMDKDITQTEKKKLPPDELDATAKRK